MNIFELCDLVYYSGDYSDSQRNRRYLAIIDKIDESKFPWIGVRMFPSNELISVKYNFIRSVETKPTHLLKMGFQKREHNGFEYFENKGILIGFFYFPIKSNHFYIAGYRILPSFPFVIDINKYLIKNSIDEIDHNKFNIDFPEANNLNYLLKTLIEKGLKVPKIENFDDLMPEY